MTAGFYRHVDVDALARPARQSRIAVVVENKFPDSRVLNGLFGLVFNLPFGDWRAVGVREDEPMNIANLGLLSIGFDFGQDLPAARG